MAANAAVNGIITQDSSITEVLNIVAYLTIPTATRIAALPAPPTNVAWFNKEHSVMNATGDVPGPSDPNGFYTNAAALAPLDLTLFQATGPVAGNRLYNLDTMAVEPAGAPALDVIPVCIRRREGPVGAVISQVANVAAGAGSDGNIPAGAGGNVLVTSLMSDCVKQMINILENTRTIFGPKGWTALFSQVKGGGAKRTHRQHRRKYSSKHY